MDQTQQVQARNNWAPARIHRQFPTRMCRHGRLSPAPPPYHPLRDLIIIFYCRRRLRLHLLVLQPRLMRRFSCATKMSGCVKTTVCCSPRFPDFVDCTMNLWWSFSTNPKAQLCRIPRG
jgi:hypothetical protein